jgi:hypothetical protein
MRRLTRYDEVHAVFPRADPRVRIVEVFCVTHAILNPGQCRVRRLETFRDHPAGRV